MAAVDYSRGIRGVRMFWLRCVEDDDRGCYAISSRPTLFRLTNIRVIVIVKATKHL
jgi:hypothetical protein